MEMLHLQNALLGEIRMVMKNGQPWFVAGDVCDVFGEKNKYRAMQTLDEDEKGYTQIDTAGGRQSVAIVSESGLYALLFAMQPSKARGVSDAYIRDRTDKLKAFKRWITHDVLPCIRRNDMYVSDAMVSELFDDPDRLIALLEDYKKHRERNRQIIYSESLNATEMLPK